MILPTHPSRDGDSLPAAQSGTTPLDPPPLDPPPLDPRRLPSIPADHGGTRANRCITAEDRLGSHQGHSAAGTPLVFADNDAAIDGSRLGRRGISSVVFAWLFQKEPGWIASTCFHAALVIALGLVMLPHYPGTTVLSLMMGDGSDGLSDFEELVVLPAEMEFESEDMAPELTSEDLTSLPVLVPDLSLPPLLPSQPAGDSLESSTDGQADGPAQVAAPGGVAGRRGRRGAAGQLGATAESEEAVDRALNWLVRHQASRGNWSFDLRSGKKCKGRCSHPGSGRLARNGATALGVLPFLGAGHTHRQGEHRYVVAAALEYLVDHQQAGGSFYEPRGRMYSHALATLALCEDLAMTQEADVEDPSDDRYRRRRTGAFERRLRSAAQRGLDFIVATQHIQGGWRYERGMPGDTSVVGWQAMALQSGRMAGLEIGTSVMDGVSMFLDSVSPDDYGATYGYTDAMPRPGTTAVGLLTRMYLGWDRGHPGIVNGVEYLAELGPSSNNIYYDYYATQVMHHSQGPAWERWNTVLREHLVETQSRRGSEAGSWYFDGDFGSGEGGRLYITSMAAMTLEVYYRHMPIYSREAVGQDEL